jgi:P27 family predicted phage terminase small subunit
MKAPKTLSREAKNLWRGIQEEYSIEDAGGLAILQAGLEAFDTMRRCQKIIGREGMQLPDRFGQMKAHPLLTVERDSRAQMLGALKQLNLDLEPLRNGPGRPGILNRR